MAEGALAKIESFSGNYRFLSNFFRPTANVVLDGVEYSSVEHAYQAAKTTDTEARKQFQFGTPSGAKRLGRELSLRFDWETVKEVVMLDLLRQKFIGTDLEASLLSTEDAELIEGNYWQDIYWGVCGGVGQNRLGVLLMQVRDELKAQRHKSDE